jgi:hypothetical protein
VTQVNTTGGANEIRETFAKNSVATQKRNKAYEQSYAFWR